MTKISKSNLIDFNFDFNQKKTALRQLVFFNYEKFNYILEIAEKNSYN